MPTTFSFEQINERLQKIPQEMRDLIGSDKLSKGLQAIAQKYQLHVDQTGLLGDEINYLLLGLIDQGRFLHDLKEELKLSEEQSKKIAEDVGEQIYAPIRKELQEIYKPAQAEMQSEKPLVTPLPEKPVQRAEKKESGESLERTHLLKEIEHIAVPRESELRITNNELRGEQKNVTPPVNLPTGNIAEAKLAGMFTLPRKEVRSTNTELREEKEELKQPQKQYSVDPYREPIDKTN